MKKITINLADPGYKIYIGENLLFSQYLLTACRKHANSVVVIADKNVKCLYAKPLLDFLHQNHIRAYLLTFTGGEKNKTRATKEALENKMLKLGCGRDSCIIALGGGITTDIAGFVASTYCRGIPTIYIPTSLLAMVDASIGGKTGVNTVQGKNLIGTFYQPQAVFIDINTLKTLPPEELQNGMVELIKHALIRDAKLFSLLERHSSRIKNLDARLLEKVIVASCNIKKQIVECDEKEISGMRQLCNFGHTVGHALENVSQYQVSHGRAVALGIIAASHLAWQMGFLPQKDLIKIQNIFALYNIPMGLPKNCTTRKLKNAMCLDKKSVHHTPYFVLLNRIGKFHMAKTGYSMPVPNGAIDSCLRILNGG